jgi:hypothetical protein
MWDSGKRDSIPMKLMNDKKRNMMEQNQQA